MQVENDASAAAVAELVQGVGTRYEDFLHISLTTFIGAGLVLDGTLQTGPHGNTAAFGPFPVAPSSLASVPKPSGPFEILLHRASIYTLVNHLRLGGVKITQSATWILCRRELRNSFRSGRTIALRRSLRRSSG